MLRNGNAEQKVSEPEPEGDQQPREPGEGLQQEEVAHPLPPGRNLAQYNTFCICLDSF